MTATAFATDTFEVEVSVVARALAIALDDARHTYEHMDDTVARFVSEYGLVLPDGRSADWVGGLPWDHIVFDRVYDSEMEMAMRASVAVLTSLYPEAMCRPHPRSSAHASLPQTQAPCSTTPVSAPKKASGPGQDGLAGHDTPGRIHTFCHITLINPAKDYQAKKKRLNPRKRGFSRP